mmetsp:Transcript_5450/g.13626  ORF Transcript_5450/g.13626 Transcript_5450/m.13626 type:complete len:378 (-) Transcript_5450:1558-2691(-)
MRPEGQPCASTTVTRTLLAASHAERFTTTSCWVTSWSCPRGRRILRQMSTLGRSGGPSRAQSGRTTGRRRFTGPSARPSSSRASESNTGCRISSSQKQLRPSRRKTWCWGTAGWWLPLQNTQKGWGKSTRPWQSPRFQRSCPQSASGKRNNVAQVRLSRQCTTPLYLSTHTLILFYISVQLLLLESHDNEFVFTVTFLIVIFFLLSSLRTQWLSLLLLLFFFFFFFLVLVLVIFFPRRQGRFEVVLSTFSFVLGRIGAKDVFLRVIGDLIRLPPREGLDFVNNEFHLIRLLSQVHLHCNTGPFRHPPLTSRGQLLLRLHLVQSPADQTVALPQGNHRIADDHGAAGRREHVLHVLAHKLSQPSNLNGNLNGQDEHVP